MQKKSDGKRKIFAIFGKKSKPSVIESTASSDSLGDRSVSPDGSDESADRPRSLSPQPPQVIQAPPRAKKRAAPKPPQINGSGSGPGAPPPAAAPAPAPAPAPVAARPPSELSEGAESVESRQSSDSSGYHEAGLSDAPDSPTERAPAPAPATSSNLGTVSSLSTSNLNSSNLTLVNSTSTVSLSSAIRKRRAPPPPAIPRIAEDPQSPATRPERAPPAAVAAAAASVASQPVEQSTRQSEESGSKPGSSRGSTCSSPETTQLKAPLRQDSGTSSTETLTADNPTPAPTPAPAPTPTQAPAPVTAPAAVSDTDRQLAPSAPAIDQPETVAKPEPVSQKQAVDQSIDRSQPTTKEELSSSGDADVKPEPAPVAVAVQDQTEAAARRTSIEKVPAPAVEEVEKKEPVPEAARENVVEEILPKPEPDAICESPAPAAESPAAVPKKETTPTPDPPSPAPTAPAPVVTETSAPVVLEAQTPVTKAPSPVRDPPTTPTTVCETLPTEPRQKAPAPSPAPVSSSSPQSSPEPPRSSAEDSERSMLFEEEEEEDSETVRLQQEVDSALACLDSNLDEALAETAAFTESGSLPIEARRPVEAETETETLPAVVREAPKTASEPPSVVQETPIESSKVADARRVVLTSRERVEETREVIETLLPVARAAPTQTQEVTAKASDISRNKDTAVVTENQQKIAPAPAPAPAPSPAAEAVQETSLLEKSRTTTGKTSDRPAPEERPTEPSAPRGRRQTPKLGPATRQRPVEAHEEVVERVEKVQRNRMTSKDIKLHIERKLASFDQPARSVSQLPQLMSPPASAPVSGAGADSPGWEYRLPAPPTPFQDQAVPTTGGKPLEAPLEFQDNMTVTSSEPSEAGEIAEATNAPLLERVSQSEPSPPPADQSDPPAPDVSARPAKPDRRRSGERLSRQMSFSIGAYAQREAAASEGGRLQKADSFHYLKSGAQAGTAAQPPSGDSAVPERSPRRAVTRRRSSDAADRGHQRSGHRSTEGDRGGAEPVRPPRRYELKFNSSKSFSMLNLSNGGLTMPTERTSPGLNKTQSQTDLALESEVSDIQSEFLKLQRQFLHWQQQLLQNQSILQTKVAPLAGRPAAASLQSLEVRHSPPPPVCVEGLPRRRPAAPQLPAGGVRGESPRGRRQAPQPPPPPPPPPDGRGPPAPVPAPAPVPSPARELGAAVSSALPSSTECSTSADLTTPGTSSSSTSLERGVSSTSLSSERSTSPPKAPKQPSTSSIMSQTPSTSSVMSSTPSTSSQSSQTRSPVAAPPPLSTPLSPVSSAPAHNPPVVVRVTRQAAGPAPSERRRTPPPVPVKSGPQPPAKSGPQQLASRRRQVELRWMNAVAAAKGQRLQPARHGSDTDSDGAAAVCTNGVIEELRRRVPEQDSSDPEPPPVVPPPADHAGRSQSLPRGAGLQGAKLSLAEQPEEGEERSTPPRQRAATLEREPEKEPEKEPEPVKKRASTLERKPSETREKRVPWSPPKVALGTWADQSRQSQVQLKEDRDYVLRQAAPAPAPVQQTSQTSQQSERRPGTVSVRPTKSVTVTSLGAPPPPVGVPQPPQVNGTSHSGLSAVAKVRNNESVPAPTSVLPQSTNRSASTRQPPAFSISDSKPTQPGRMGAAGGRFTSVVSLTEEPRQPHTVSVQVSKTASRPAARSSDSAAVTCRVSPPTQQQRTVPSVVSVTRKDSATATEPAARQTADAGWRSRHQPVVKGFRQSELPAPVPPPPPPPAPVLPSAAAGRARLKPVSTGRPTVPKLDPREELMIAIREHGGLKKRGGVRP